MKVKHIPVSWIIEGNHRLDCGPFTSGALEARKIIENLQCVKDPLASLTHGGISGIYHVGQDKLQWVENPAYGVPLLRSADILKSDWFNQPYILKDQVKGNPLFLCPEGSTLITRSGTIGRMAYTRTEMAEMAISQDVLKVVPQKDKVLPGFLYAFLSSRFGIPQVIGGTFGSIIVHIEAENIADLDVPRLDPELEQEIHNLVELSSQKRTLASRLLEKGQTQLIENLGLPPIELCKSLWAVQSSSYLQKRFDAFHFCEANKFARKAFDSANSLKSLKAVSEVFIPKIFKRKYADDPQFGYPYITGADVFELAPTSDQHLMKSVAEGNHLVLKKGMILIQEAGQLSGLLGHSAQVGSYLDGFACTNNMVRVTPYDPKDRGYLFTVLSSEYGVRLIQREAAGSSIPHIEVGRIQDLEIPWPAQEVRQRIGKPAMEAQDLRDEACEMENQARELVEKAIEEAA